MSFPSRQLHFPRPSAKKLDLVHPNARAELEQRHKDREGEKDRESEGEQEKTNDSGTLKGNRSACSSTLINLQILDKGRFHSLFRSVSRCIRS